jgi:hypothetical protein
METDCVLIEVRAGFLHIIHTNFGSKWLKRNSDNFLRAPTLIRNEDGSDEQEVVEVYFGVIEEITQEVVLKQIHGKSINRDKTGREIHSCVIM